MVKKIILLTILILHYNSFTINDLSFKQQLNELLAWCQILNQASDKLNLSELSDQDLINATMQKIVAEREILKLTKSVELALRPKSKL